MRNQNLYDIQKRRLDATKRALLEIQRNTKLANNNSSNRDQAIWKLNQIQTLVNECLEYIKEGNYPERK